MYYAKSTGGFYTAEIHGSAIPADAVEITDAQHQELLTGQSTGKCITADAEGAPILTDPVPPKVEELITLALTQVRALRAPIFASLAGMQSQALATGDPTLAASIAVIQDQLKALPDIDLSSCKTQADLDAALTAAWKAIVVTVPEAVLSAFKAVV